MLSCSSCVRLFVTPWTVAHQALLSVGFSRHECWSGLPCPPLGGLLNPEMEPEPMSLMSPALTVRFFTTRKRKRSRSSCLTLCDPRDCRIHGILLAIVLEWVAISFSIFTTRAAWKAFCIIIIPNVCPPVNGYRKEEINIPSYFARQKAFLHPHLLSLSVL